MSKTTSLKQLINRFIDTHTRLRYHAHELRVGPARQSPLNCVRSERKQH